jgi:hypothetical protein
LRHSRGVNSRSAIANELDDLLEAARSCAPQERFQLGKAEFDRIEIRTVRR